MSDDTYVCHANAEKNDFSNWVRDVIGDARLSDDLKKAAKAVGARLAFLSSKIQAFCLSTAMWRCSYAI